MNQTKRFTGENRVHGKTMLVYLLQSVTVANMFFVLENGSSLYLLNIIKNIMYDFVRYMFKIAMQSLKVQVSCCKTHRIKDIILKNTNPYNLDIIPKIGSNQ